MIRDYFGNKVDVVVSDMAVNTTGNKNLDSIYTSELCIKAMNFSVEILKNDGKFISKIFMGSTFNEIVSEAKRIFKENKVFKPLASRKDSKESFIICKFLR
jgi:23S rRNA (uridine2552-2'-O)-methyltransferase